MKDTRIVKLGRQEAIDAIKAADTVLYQYGCWNPYETRKTSEVVEIIKDYKRCPYGADVWKNENTYIVCVPNKSDMW